jgi:hypothetical protein
MRIILKNDSKVYRRKRQLIQEELDALWKGWTTANEIEKRAVARLLDEITGPDGNKLFKEGK